MGNQYNFAISGLPYPILTAVIALVFTGVVVSAQGVQAQDPAYENLYLVGNAAPGGWSISSPTPMDQDADNPLLFVYDGILFPGEFKFSTFTGDWCDGDWLLATSQHPQLDDTAETGYTVYTGCPPEEEDFKWLIDREEMSEYEITVDLENETVGIVYKGPAEMPYEQLYILGNALPVGWDIENPTPLVKNDNEPWIFTLEAFLSPGEFKISTFAGDWCDEEDWIRPPTMHAPLSDTEYIITTGCPPDEEDFKWQITPDDVGDYTITVDLLEETIAITEFDQDAPPFNELFLVGDASPGGWSLDEQTPLQQDPDNPFVFTWSGDLIAGEFKFKTYPESDFCSGEWIHPLVHAQGFTETDYEILQGCGDHDDNKWVVTEDQVGPFEMTIDTENNTIVFTGDQVPTFADDYAGSLPLEFRLEQNYPNPFNPTTTISYSVPERSSVTLRVFDIAGREVATLVNGVRERGVHSATLDASQLAGGVYFYRMEAGGNVQVRKMLLVK